LPYTRACDLFSKLAAFSGGSIPLHSQVVCLTKDLVGALCPLRFVSEMDMRVVIHPKYRSIGLGAKLIRETLTLAGTPFVELIAVMAKYSPFAEKAGMKKTAEQRATEKLLDTSKILTELGFDLQLLGSDHYVREKLEGLFPEQVSNLKEAFIKNRHLRFKELVTGRHRLLEEHLNTTRALEKLI
jgi:hypothetical protein